MVASISSITSSSGSTKYFAQDGYYMEGSEEMQNTMSWHGKGAEEIGLIGENMTPEQFKAIMDGHVPGTDIRLGRIRNGEHEHKPGTDVTFSAPKSVSLAGLVGGDNRVIEAHRNAVKSTLNFIEREILQSRAVNKETGQFERVKGQRMVAATFDHETSRNLDPQLHTHATIANMAKGEDGKWRTIENRSLYTNIMLIGAHYHNELAANLKDQGYGIAKTGKNGQFEVTDANGKPLYSKEVIDAFSTRSAEIKAAMRDLDYDQGDPALKQRATLLTRAAKESPDRGLMQEMWKEQAQEFGLDTDLGRKGKSGIFVGPAQPRDEISAVASVEWAIRHLEERNSVFSRENLLAATIGRDPGHLSLDAISRGVAEFIDNGRLVETKIGREGGFTTDKALAIERETISRMESSQNTVGTIITAAATERHLAETTLTSGQIEAVETILCSHDRVVGVQGYAGSGKTTMLRTAREIAEEEGKGFFNKETHFIGLAPSASAAHTLEQEAGVESSTLQSFLTKYSAISEDRAGGGMISKMQNEVKGSVILVDEASMVSSGQMRDLLKITDALEPSRVVLVGDIKQLDAVNAGLPFKQLQQAGMETAVMDQIMRQRDDNLKAAVIEALSGEPRAALERLEKDIIETPHSEMAKTAAQRWLMLPPERQENTGLMAPTHALREEINQTIRDEFSRDGIIHGEGVEINQLLSTRFTEAEREVAANYREGEVVLFERGISSAGIESGDTLPVLGNRDGVVYLETKQGEVVGLDPAGGMASNLEVYQTADMELRTGDVLRWTRNDKEFDLINTHQAEVTSVNDGKVSLLNEDGREIVLPAEHPALQHSDYAFNSTVHAFQGRTVENVIAILDSTHQELTNQKTFYVEISRARESATLITDDLTRLADTLDFNTGEQMTGLESIAEELGAGLAVEERLDASIQQAREGLSLEEFENINADAPDIAEYDGPEHDPLEESLEHEMLYDGVSTENQHEHEYELEL
jgi:conjugative relaxase-like TrwC/TraI family protein